MVEGERREPVDRVPGRVCGKRGVDVRRDEPEVCGSQLPVLGAAGRGSARLELLQVRELADVDLVGQMAADRLLERLIGGEEPAGQRPRSGVRLTRTLPEQDLQLGVADLEDDRQRDVRRARPGEGGRIVHRFSPLSIKPEREGEKT